MADQTPTTDNTVVVGHVWRAVACVASYRLEPLIFIATLAGTLLSATSQNLIMDRVCTVNLGYNSTVCDNITSRQFIEEEDRVQTLANQYVLYKNVVESAPGMFFALFMGPWSDLHGRKLPLLLPLSGTILTCVVFIVFAAYPGISAQYLILAGIPVGLTGGSACLLMATFSYISDITGAKDRTARIGILEICFFAPLAVGFVLAGYIVSKLGYLVLYCLSGTLSVVALLYGFLLVPESRSPADLAAARARSAANTMSSLNKGYFRHVLSTCFRRRHGYNRSTILLTILGFMAHQMALSGELVVALPYVKRVLDWSYMQYTTYVCTILVGCMLLNVLVLPLLSYVLGVRDSLIGLVSEMLRITGLILRYFVHTTRLFYMATLVGLPGSMTSVTLRSILSKTVPREELGVVFSFLAAVESISALITSSSFLLLYNALLDRGPGTIFLVTAGITGVTLMVLIICTVRELRGEIGYTQVLIEQEEQEERAERRAAEDNVSDDTNIFQQQ